MNRAVVTVKELSRDDLPALYLWRFTHDATGETATAQIPLASTNDRYDLFVIEEGQDITLPYPGDYRYEIYQMPNAESLDPAYGVKVEEGKMEFNETPVEVPAHNTNFTAKVYEPSTGGS